MGAAEMALLALGEHPHKKVRIPNRGVIVTAKSHKDGIEDEILPKLQEVVGSKDIVRIVKDKQGRPSTIHWRSKSITHLMSAEQDDVAFESKTLDLGWIDEPVRRQIYIAIRRGMMKSGGLLWMTATPLDEPWVYDEIYLPGMEGHPDIEVFEGSTDENVYIPKHERDAYFATLTSDEVEARRYGRFAHLSGRVIKSYVRERHLIAPFDIPYHWPVYLSIDPGGNKPHAALWIAVSPQNIKYACNEIYVRDTIKNFGLEVLAINEQYNMADILIDTSAQEQDWDKKSAREILQDIGVDTRLAQKKNLKKSGLLLINQHFQEDQLFVFENCVRLHRELTLYTYQKNKRDTQKILEEPEKKFDDMIDNMRYILVERPDFSGPAKEVSYV